MRIARYAGVFLFVAAFVFAQSDRQQELQLVDNLQKAREVFSSSLEKLTNYYAQSGQHLKLEKAREELSHHLTYSPINYVTMSDVPRPAAKANRFIEEAEILFQDAVMYKEYPDLFNKKDKLIVAIARFRRLFAEFPDSDRADDAAYMLAEIRRGHYFGDWQTALELYENCIQWDEGTEYPARFRAAEIYLDKMKDYDKAAEYFRWTVNNDPNDNFRTKALEQLTKMREGGLLSE